jgi:hypothetical protein
MWNWLKRREERQRDLERGVDADLVRDNVKLSRLSLSAWLVGCVLVLSANYLPLPKWAQGIITFVGFGLVATGLVFEKWARAEKVFLDKPDPEEPPRMFKL